MVIPTILKTWSGNEKGIIDPADVLSIWQIA
jgi:hypothetical protein